MMELSYRRHRFPPVVIQHAVWVYLRFALSYRSVDDLLAERGLDVSYETIRSWVLKFGPLIAQRLRRCRPRPSDRWHLDEMVVRIAGKRMYLWRAVDHEGEVLDMLVQWRKPGCGRTGGLRGVTVSAGGGRRWEGVVRLTYRDQRSPKQDGAITLPPLHSAIRSSPRRERSAALAARPGGVERRRCYGPRHTC
jgi:DDE domain